MQCEHLHLHCCAFATRARARGCDGCKTSMMMNLACTGGTASTLDHHVFGHEGNSCVCILPAMSPAEAVLQQPAGRGYPCGTRNPCIALICACNISIVPKTDWYRLHMTDMRLDLEPCCCTPYCSMPIVNGRQAWPAWASTAVSGVHDPCGGP